MLWLEKSYNFFLGCLCLLAGLVTGVLLSPLIIICFIVLLTPKPFTLLVNLVFPIFFFIGAEGARTCLNALLSAVRFTLDKAAGYFRTSKEIC